MCGVGFVSRSDAVTEPRVSVRMCLRVHGTCGACAAIAGIAV